MSPAVSFVPGVLKATPAPTPALDPAHLFAVSSVAVPTAAPDVLHMIPASAGAPDPESFFVARAAVAPAAPMFADVLLPNTSMSVITRELSTDNATSMIDVSKHPAGRRHTPLPLHVGSFVPSRSTIAIIDQNRSGISSPFYP